MMLLTWRRSKAGRVLQAALLAALTALALQPVLAQVPANAYDYGRTSAYTYDAVGRVLSETTEPDYAAWCVISTHAYDAWGNRTSSTQANCAGSVPTRQQFTSRTSSVSYTATSGLFPTSGTNALAQTNSAAFDARFGAKTSTIDIAGLSSSWTLDDFGRVIRETRPDGTRTVFNYCYIPGRVSDTSSNSTSCDSTASSDTPADAASYIHSEPRNAADAKMGPYSRVYADRLGRQLRSVTESFDGTYQPGAYSAQLIASDATYSAVGTKIMVTQAYFLGSGSSTTSGSNDVGVTLTQYDALGRGVATYSADPHGLAGSQSFGAYGSKTAAKTLMTYSGQTTTISNDRGQVRLEEKNAIGLVVRITDPAGGQLAHQHDAFGNLVATKDALQNSITVQFDIRGRRMQLNDPDSGLSKYDYNALGEVVWSETANQRAASTATTMAYDKLGRMTSRTEPEGTGTWAYDRYIDNSICQTGAGRLCESRFVRAGTSDTRSTRVYYDSLGRPISDVASVTSGATAGPTMATAKAYDSLTGRLQSKTYPTGLQVGYGYTPLGYLAQLKLLTQANLSPLPATAGGTPGSSTTLAANTVLWQAKAINAWGKAEQQGWSNGITGMASYEAATGRTTALSAGPGGSNTVLDYSYTWDSLNNLTWRADNIGDAVAGAVTESFEYADSLSRLTKYTVAAPAVPNGSRAVTLQYNALGMLLNKSDVGVYTFGASGPSSSHPHALLSMAPTGGGAAVHYAYDANGNLQSADGGKYRTVAYTSFNLPDSQAGIGGAPNGSSGGTASYTWVYDENHQRIKEVRTIAGGAMAGTRTTWYLHPDNAGALGFESEVSSPTSATAANPAGTSNRHYLTAGGITVGVLVSTGSLPTISAGQTAPPAQSTMAVVKLEVWHKDHLGSLLATSDHAGTVTARYAYDPFGKRRFTNGSYDPFGNIVVDWSQATNAGTDRGFTEHEHLDDIGLIHMNGRIFDPMLGLFLQADPHIQQAGNLQNYNRYAYCYNNPLTCTDPTGLIAEEYWDYIAQDGGAESSIGGESNGFSDALATKPEEVTVTGLRWGNRADRAELEQQYNQVFNVIQQSANTTWLAGVDGNVFVAIGKREPKPTPPGPAANAPYGPSQSPQLLDQLISAADRLLNTLNGNCGTTVTCLTFTPGATRGAALGRAAKEAPLLLNAPRQMMDHHLMPRQFKDFFTKRGIDIDAHTVSLGDVSHLKGVYGNGFGNMPGKWNQQWGDWISKNPNATAKDIYQHLGGMMDRYHLNDLRIHPHGK